MNPIANEQLNLIKTKYPQAHICWGKNSHLLIIPGVELPAGWNKTICTVLTVIPTGYPASPPNNFYVDLPDISLSDGTWPINFNRSNNIPGFPEWDNGVAWFQWHLQAWNPNRDTLYTWMKTIMKRFDISQ